MSQHIKEKNGSFSQNIQSERKKPNFFIIGAPKCGTSALHEYLKRHSHICMSNIKEPEYFVTDEKRRKFKPSSFDEYLDLFNECTSEHMAIGEASTAYLYSKEAVKNIYEFNPTSKIIIMLRNPVVVAHSLHSQLLLGLFEDECDFKKAWMLQESRRNGKNIPKFCSRPSMLQYAQVVMFGEQVKRVLDIFPREQIKIILFEDFKSSTKNVYEDVLKFIDVPSDGRTEFPAINQNEIIRINWLNYFLRFISNSFLINLKSSFGIRRNLITGRSVKWNLKTVRRKPLDTSFKSELKYQFRDDIEKLSHLIDRDLTSWLE